MNKILEQNKEEDEKPIPWTPRVITGGKGPPDFPGDPNNPDWLTPLPEKTIFLVEHKKSTDCFAIQCQKLRDGMKSVLISLEGQDRPHWALPMKFCRDFRFIETIMSAEEFELELKAREQVEKNNDSNWTNR